MLALTNTTNKIEVLLGGSVSANQLECSAYWADDPIDADEAEGNLNENHVATNGATAVTLVAAPTQSAQRHIKGITIYNADTASATVTVRVNDGTNTWRLIKTTMVTLGTLTWEEGNGWVNYSAAAVRS
jgi:hypothetical protein